MFTFSVDEVEQLRLGIVLLNNEMVLRKPKLINLATFTTRKVAHETVFYVNAQEVQVVK